MLEPGEPHLHVVVITFVIPIVATLLMEFAETAVDTSPFDWRERLVKTGWDLCVLAIGSTGAIFTIPQVQKRLGHLFAFDSGLLMLLLTVAFGLGIARMRRSPKVAGWQGLLALFLGGTALGLQLYIVSVSLGGVL